MRALVLDDDVGLRETLGEVLMTLGVDDVLLFESFDQLLAGKQSVLTTRLAILDINLGYSQANGTDVAHWLLDKGYTGTIVFLTGHAANHPLVKRAQERMGTRIQIFEKPIAFSRLVELVNEALT